MMHNNNDGEWGEIWTDYTARNRETRFTRREFQPVLDE